MTVAASLLPCGTRLHLSHGPIDLVIGADGERDRAFAAARARFDGLLEELVAELPLLRAPLAAEAPLPLGAVARRMDNAVRPHCARFVTRMAAVAGAVADEVLAAMRAEADLRRAYVNNGGDIAVWLGPGERFVTAISSAGGDPLGRVDLRDGDRIGGIATSGRHGRSLSLGIADSVTVLARNAAAADAAATLIANAVDLPGHPAVTRRPAVEIKADSDLGERLVTTGCGWIEGRDVRAALCAGRAVAEEMIRAGLIAGASLHLCGQTDLAGQARLTPAATTALSA